MDSPEDSEFLSQSTNKKNEGERGRIQFRPSISENPVIQSRITALNPYAFQQQSAVPVLPNRIAVPTIPSREYQRISPDSENLQENISGNNTAFHEEDPRYFTHLNTHQSSPHSETIYRIPSSVRKQRGKQKNKNGFTLSQFGIEESPEDYPDNPAVPSNNTAELFIQLKQYLKLLLRVLNGMNGSNVNLNYEKLVDKIMVIIQRIQTGENIPEILEKNFDTFSRVITRFRKIVEDYLMGSGNAQILSEIIALFKRVTSDLSQTISQFILS